MSGSSFAARLALLLSNYLLTSATTNAKVEQVNDEWGKCEGDSARGTGGRDPNREARARSERMFGTLQDRPPKELKLAGIYEIEAANRFIRD